MAPPAAPAAAPFFLPTLPGLTPRFAAPSEAEEENKVKRLMCGSVVMAMMVTAIMTLFQSKVVSFGSLAERSAFSLALEASLQSGSCE